MYMNKRHECRRYKLLQFVQYCTWCRLCTAEFNVTNCCYIIRSHTWSWPGLAWMASWWPTFSTYRAADRDESHYRKITFNVDYGTGDKLSRVGYRYTHKEDNVEYVQNIFYEINTATVRVSCLVQRRWLLSWGHLQLGSLVSNCACRRRRRSLCGWTTTNYFGGVWRKK